MVESVLSMEKTSLFCETRYLYCLAKQNLILQIGGQNQINPFFMDVVWKFCSKKSSNNLYLVATGYRIYQK
jgi:hypothetical protein